MSDSAMSWFRARLPGIVSGCDYNPEQWPRDVWREDVELMRAANARLVSLTGIATTVLILTSPSDWEN